MTLTMTSAERDAFLAGLHVGVISIEQPDSPPLSVPIWYDYDPGIGVWVITGKDSAKGRALREAGRFTLCAQHEEPPLYRYVSVEGRITEVRPAELEKDRRPMAHRYFGPDLGDLYLQDQSGSDNLVFTMRPERWRTVDYGKVSEG